MIKYPINKPIFLITNTSDILLTSILHAGQSILKCSFIYKKILVETNNKFPDVAWMKLSDEEVSYLDRNSISGYTPITSSVLTTNYNNNVSDIFISEQPNNIVNSNINNQEEPKFEGYLQ